MPKNERGDLIPIKKFIEYCECGCFIDYDGCGYYATKTKDSKIEAMPSEIKHGNINEKFRYVRWFNR